MGTKEAAMPARVFIGRVAPVVLVALMGFAGVAAQEKLFKGSVVAVEKAAVQVKTVGDDGKPTGKLEWFALTEKTKVLRGGKTMTLAEANVTADEAVAIVVAEGGEAGIEWTCSMHPAVALPEPGRCPLCKMTLKERARPAKASEIRLSAK
jgi:hypothetical protein